MSAENFMSLKYLFSKTKFNLVSFISRFSILVLIIAYFSFLTILSVFSGLEDYSISFSKSFDPDIKIEAKNGSYLFYNERIDSVLDGYNTGKVIKGNAVIRYNDRTVYAEVLGVDENFNKIINIDSIISVGRYPERNSNEVLTSYNLASSLDLILYNASGFFEAFSINPNYPENTFNPAGNSEYFVSSGVFKSRNEANENIIIADIEKVRDLFSLSKNALSELIIKTENREKNSTKLQKLLENYNVRSHKKLNETLYKIMNSEKIIVSLIMILIVFISTFNVIASTVMLIVEKENDIKTMQNLGMSKKSLKSLFFKHNFLINLLGGSIGILISIAIVSVQDYFSIFTIPGIDSPYPVSLVFSNIILVFITLIIVGLFSGYVSSLILKKLR